jgi:hypothetical protein
MAARSSLGALRADFRPSLRARWLDLAFVPIFPLLTVMVAALALETSPRQRAEALTVVWITAAVSLAIAALLIWRSWRSRGLRAALHAEGFIYRDRTGPRAFAWSDIESVRHRHVRYYRNGQHFASRHVYTIEPRTGPRFVLDTQILTDVERLGDDIVRGSTARILPASIQALERGDRVSFGPLAMDMDGLHTTRRSIPWSAVSAIEIEDGELRVVQLGKWLAWCRFEVAELANLCVLMPLLDQRSVPPEVE